MTRPPRNNWPAGLWACLVVPAILLFALPGRCAQDTFLFLLRNGDRISGVLVREDAQALTISNAIVGQVRLPLVQVERRLPVTNSPSPAVVAVASPVTNAATPRAVTNAPPPAATLNELLAVYVAGKISTEEYQRQRARLIAGLPPPVGAPRVPPLQTAAQLPPHVKHWSGEAQLGADLGFSEKQRELYTGRFKLNYANAPVRHSFDYLFTYGKDDGNLNANRMDAQLKTDYDLKRNYYLYSLAGGGYDEIRKIDWRFEIGPGLGYHVIKRTNFILRVEGGFHYDVHNFEDNKEEDAYYHRIAQDLKWNLGTLVSLDEKLEYLPQLDNFHEYKLRLETNARLWLRSNLYLNFSVIDLFDTLTAQGVGQNDLQLRSSVGVRF